MGRHPCSSQGLPGTFRCWSGAASLWQRERWRVQRARSPPSALAQRLPTSASLLLREGARRPASSVRRGCGAKHCPLPVPREPDCQNGGWHVRCAVKGTQRSVTDVKADCASVSSSLRLPFHKRCILCCALASLVG